MPTDEVRSCWDQELVEKVSAEHAIDAAIIRAMEDRRHTWMQEALDSLSMADARHHPDAFKLYRRVAMTIEALSTRPKCHWRK